MKKGYPMEAGAYSDRELVELANGGDDSAFSALADRYMPVLQGRAGRYASIVGVDVEDFIQEGMLALFRAVRHYDMMGDVQFNTFAVTCIHNAMTSAIRSHMKNLSRDAQVPLDERLLQNLPLQFRGDSPEDSFWGREATHELLQSIETLLSNFERHVLKLYLNGYTYQQIAAVLGTTSKAVDNALQRVRRKLKPEH